MRLFFTAACGSVLVGTVVFLLFMAASFLSLDRNVAVAKERVNAAFHSGQLVIYPYQEGSTTIGSHQWNDCLIAAMAVDQRGNRIRLALSPIIADFPERALDGRRKGDQPGPLDGNPCALLKLLAAGATPSPDIYHYDRYLHGATVLLRYLLPNLEIRQIRKLYRAALTAVLVSGLALSLVGIARGSRVPEFAVLAVSIMALLRFFGLESFSQSMGHGPADLIAADYVLAIVIMLFAPTGPMATLLAAAVFGALTTVFELFTGGIPLGLAMVIGLAALVVPSDDRHQAFLISACAATAFLVAATVTYVLKVATVVYVAGPGIVDDLLRKLVLYSAESDQGPTGVVALVEIERSIGVLTGGMTLLAASTVIGAIAAGSYGLGWIFLRVPNPAIRQRAALLALQVLPIPVWFLAFSSQAGPHAWFMDRIVVWIIAAGFSLFVMAMTTRYRVCAESDALAFSSNNLRLTDTPAARMTCFPMSYPSHSSRLRTNIDNQSWLGER